MAKVIHGTTNDNQINASADKTQVYGLKGNDTLTSDNKSDILLVGGSGNDSLIMTGGNGTLSGGAGADVFEFTYSADKPISAVIEDLNPSEDKIVVNYVGNTVPQLASSINGNDVIWSDGDNFNLTLKSVRDNDYYDGPSSEEIWKVLELTNQAREEASLPALTLSDGLTAGASIRADEISALGEKGLLTDHTRPDGTPYDTVLKGKYNSSGENLDGGARSVAEVMEDWMNSTLGHRENILNSEFTKLGVGYNENDTDKSDHRFYWTQLFADSIKSPEIVPADSILTASITADKVTKFILGDHNGNTIENSDYGVTIQAGGGNDSITNTGLLVSINGGDDSDTVNNSGAYSTINAGKGNDSIIFAESSRINLIEYSTGDGNDTINGLHSSDTISISGDEFTPATVGNDVVIAVGTGSITLLDATDMPLNILGTKSNFLMLTDGDDTLESSLDNATIAALAGKDYIRNSGDNVSIDGGKGNDHIYNEAESRYNEDTDEYEVTLSPDNVTINGGTDDDSINNSGDFALINGDEGNDEITNYGSFATLDGGTGDDLIWNLAGNNVIINAGEGNDRILNDSDSANTSITGGAGDDTISNDGDNVTIDGGAGNDSIRYNGSNVTIEGGTGDDVIEGSRIYVSYTDGRSETIQPSNILFKYSVGDGNDRIEGFDETSTLSISGAEYSPLKVDNDIIVEVGTSSITLAGAASLDAVNINDEEIKPLNIVDEEGNGYIFNQKNIVSISGGAGNDTIENKGESVTILGGADDDQISLSSDSRYNLISYEYGDGSDTISGFNSTDTLEINDFEGSLSTQTSRNNVIISIGDDSITLTDAASLESANIIVNWSKPVNADNLITLSEVHDNYGNDLEDATIDAGAGNDSIYNDYGSSNVSINGGAGGDYIENESDSVTIDGGAGNDSIYNDWSENVTINGGAGDDYIENDGDNVSIDGGAGNDSIDNSHGDSVTINGGTGNDSIENGWSDNVSIDAGAGDDSIVTSGESVTINAGTGNDSIENRGYSVTINAGEGNDSIVNNGAEEVSINSGDGDDTIVNGDGFSFIGGDNITLDGGAGNDSIYSYSGESSSVNGGAGDDTIDNKGSYSTISGGAGNDLIMSANTPYRTNYPYATFIYASGDGNDTIIGFDETSTLSITEGEYSTQVSGSDIIVTVGDGSIILQGAASLASVNIGNEVTKLIGENIENDKDSTLISGTELNDEIYNDGGSNVTINGNAGDDFIRSDEGNNVSLSGGAGDDDIRNNDGNAVTMDGGDDDDRFLNWGGDSVKISGGNGNDYVDNWSGDSVMMDGGDGDDYINNDQESSTATILGGNGSDTIRNGGENVTIDGGDGNDSISTSYGNSVTINGGKGDDYIERPLIDEWNEETNEYELVRNGSNIFFIYNEGNGNDTIVGSDENSSLQIGDGNSTYSTLGSGDDLIILVGEGSITLKDARNKPPHIILGESNTSDGTSSDTGDSPSSDGRGGSDSGRGKSRGDTSTNDDSDDNSDNDITDVAGVSENISDNSNSNFSGGGNNSGNSSSTTTVTTSTPTVTSETHSYIDNAAALQVETQPAPDEKLSLSFPTDWNFPSPAEITSNIQSGQGSQLWGTPDNDTLYGTDADDIFIGGKNQGSDTFLNVSARDIVYLSDVTLGDLSRINKEGDMVTFAFKNGNSVSIQSSDTVSGAVVLGDLTLHFQHTTQA